MIDFARSFMTFFLPDGGNIARIQLDAACTLSDAQGAAETFYLIAPCRAEHMYRDEPLFQLPNYEFCGIWSASEFLIIRTHWLSERDNHQYGRHSDRFAECRLHVVPLSDSQALTSSAAVVAATLDHQPLVATTELYDAASGRRALLEYPIRTMNVLRQPPRFQIDTGPLIVPDLTTPVVRTIERFELAYVAYHRLDQAEFIRRRPRPIHDDEPAGPAVTDYSSIQIGPAQTRLYAGH